MGYAIAVGLMYTLATAGLLLALYYRRRLPDAVKKYLHLTFDASPEEVAADITYKEVLLYMGISILAAGVVSAVGYSMLEALIQLRVKETPAMVVLGKSIGYGTQVLTVFALLAHTHIIAKWTIGDRRQNTAD